MTNHEIERRLEQALYHTAPDDLDRVLSRCETQKGAGNAMTIKMPNKAIRTLVAACLTLAVLGGGGGLFYQQAYAVASVVSLDVNPSIELKVSNREKVLSCVPLNTEADQILADMGGGADLRGIKLDVAVNAIVGSLVRYGYLESISSAILISVEDNNTSRAAKLRQELTASVDAVLKEESAKAAVLSQTVTQDPALETQARANQISTGKAHLVRQVMEQNGTLALDSTTALDQLSALSVEELKDLLDARATGIPIGKSKAAQAAKTYAGVQNDDTVKVEVDSELDENPAHYEVELYHPTLGKFEYKVEGFTGEVISGRADITKVDTKPSVTTPSTQGDIGQEAAKKIALKDAKTDAAQASRVTVKRDYDDGRLEYEIEFWVGGIEYDYTIDGVTGAILSRDTDLHDDRYDDRDDDWDDDYDDDRNSSTSQGDIGKEAAKKVALQHAGVSASQASRMKAEQDHDDGRLEYEIEFWVGGTEYDYTIDGATGAVLSHDIDRDDDRYDDNDDRDDNDDYDDDRDDDHDDDRDDDDD